MSEPGTETSSPPTNPWRPLSLVLIVIAVGATIFLLNKRDKPPVETAEKIQLDPVRAVESLGGTVKRDSSNWLSVTLPVADAAALDRLVQLKNVASLELNGTSLNDDDLRLLHSLTDLEALNLHGTNITDAGLAHLTAFPELEHLNLSGTRVTGAGLIQLKHLPNLRVLLLGETRIDDESLPHLADLHKLQLLFLNGPLPEDKLDNDQLGQITDNGLKLLGELTNLGILDVRNNQTTDAGMEQLKTALPNCDIRF